jgi:hypothetical protein
MRQRRPGDRRPTGGRHGWEVSIPEELLEAFVAAARSNRPVVGNAEIYGAGVVAGLSDYLLKLGIPAADLVTKILDIWEKAKSVFPEPN